ncbi:MAG: DedA family protein [Peptococcaceae bacterium]|nr:DedA family protein [Peptococcaceae bacterium]
MYEKILEYLVAMGVAGLTLGAFVEAMGFPFPGGSLLILGGFLANRGHWPLYQVGAGVFLGFTAGSLTAFFIGRHFGLRFIGRWGRYLKITPLRLEKTRSWLDHSAAGFIILGRFVPWVSNVTPYAAGLSRLSPGQFLFFNTIYTVLWAGVYISLGHVLGRQAQPILDLVKKRLPLAAAIFLLSWVVFFLVRRRLKRGSGIGGEPGRTE